MEFQELVEMQENKPFSFLLANGKTYVRSGEGQPFLAFSFIMKKVGYVKGMKKPHCAYIISGQEVNSNDIVERNIVLTSSDFKTKDAFWKALNDVEGIEIHMYEIVKNGVMDCYYNYLESMIDRTELKEYRLAPFIGFQNGVWVLSDKIHIQNGVVLSKVQRTHILTNDLYHCQLTVKEKLFTDEEHFLGKFRSIISLTKHYRCNRDAVIHALSFTITRLISVMHHETVAAESKYAVLATGDKSVGKSSIQNIVAQGQGIPSTSHPFAAAGGDGSAAGTTLYKQMQILALSNIVIIFNELDISSQMVGKALNQAHDSYGCQSVGRGTIQPKASLLASSNELIPHKKLDTRIQIITCQEGEDFDKISDKKALDETLTQLVNKNPGFLIAWCVHYNEMVRKAIDEIGDDVANEIMNTRNDLKSRLLDAKRDNVIIAFLVLIQYENDKDFISPSAIYNKIVGQSVHVNAIDKQKFWAEILELIKTDNEATTWFHPMTGFKRTDQKGKERGGIIPSVAIHVDKMKSIHSVTFKDIELYLGTYGKRAHNAHVRFSNKDISWKEWKAAEKNNKARACKFPWSEIPMEIANKIVEVCKMTHISDSPASENESSSLVNELYSNLKKFYQNYGRDDENNATTNATEEIPLTPEAKKHFDEMNTPNKRIYKQAFEDIKRARLMFEE